MAEPIDHLQERVLVSNLLFGAIGASSRNMDAFSSWLLVGFAAVAAIIFSNLGEASLHLSSHVLHALFASFFAAAVLGIVAKALAVLIVGASAGAAIGRAEGDRVVNNGVQLDISVIFSEMERAIFPPMRWLVKRSFAKAAQGNLTAAAQSFTRIAQFQALCTLAQALVVLWVVGDVACSVTF